VLLADPEARVIGACHAGWRGALAGVIDATLAEMQRLGARQGCVAAAVGPAIGRSSYEVGLEFPALFLAEDPGNADLFQPATRAGHYLFDLPAYVLRRLERLGIAAHHTGGDTAADERQFFSYRRTCLRHERDYGRLISAIALQD
jgi:YfiH family protein